MRRYFAILALGVATLGCGVDTAPYSNGARRYPSADSPLQETALPPGDLNIDTAIAQMSDVFCISQDRIRSMSAVERANLATRCMAIKLGKSETEVIDMSPASRFDAGLRRLADKYGISYTEARKLAELQEKFDSGLQLTASEMAFLRAMSSKMR